MLIKDFGEISIWCNFCDCGKNSKNHFACGFSLICRWVHDIPVDIFSCLGSRGLNFSKLLVGIDLNEPASSKWSSTTSIKFEVNFSFLLFLVCCLEGFPMSYRYRWFIILDFWTNCWIGFLTTKKNMLGKLWKAPRILICKGKWMEFFSYKASSNRDLVQYDTFKLYLGMSML